MKETAEEYIARVTKEAKEYYKTPEALIDENIRLLEGIKTNLSDRKEWLWQFWVAVSEAYHVVLMVNEKDRMKRLMSTILSWVKDNTGV